MDLRIQCPVVDEVFDPPLVGEVNAFRILSEAGGDFFLDFIHYRSLDDSAQVVSRIRVPCGVLGMVRDRLESDLIDVPTILT